MGCSRDWDPRPARASRTDAHFLAPSFSSCCRPSVLQQRGEMGGAVFQLTRVYMAILAVKILKQPALAYPLSPLHAPFPSGVRPHFN